MGGVIRPNVVSRVGYWKGGTVLVESARGRVARPHDGNGLIPASIPEEYDVGVS